MYATVTFWYKCSFIEWLIDLYMFAYLTYESVHYYRNDIANLQFKLKELFG